MKIIFSSWQQQGWGQERQQDKCDGGEDKYEDQKKDEYEEEKEDKYEEKDKRKKNDEDDIRFMLQNGGEEGRNGTGRKEEGQEEVKRWRWYLVHVAELQHEPNLDLYLHPAQQ